MVTSIMGIADLDNMVASLQKEDMELFHRLYRLSVTTGRIKAHPELLPWIERQFGSVEAVLSQKVVKLTNMVTFEGSVFNRLRSSRPIAYREKLDIEARIMDSAREDPLQNPERDTPEDTFGRIKGKYSCTASNIAKYDGFHGLIVFERFNPMAFSTEMMADYVDTAWRWAQKAHEVDPSAKYFFFLWNNLRRAGASLLHGHAQVTLSRDMHYAKIEALRRAALDYRSRYGSDYFDDLYRVHHSLGCAVEEKGVRVLTYLTPVKEKEVMLLANGLGSPLTDMMSKILTCFRDRIYVTAFNLVLVTPPLAQTEESWEGFPVIVRLVDRGDPKMRSCDIGAMELYASSVISGDPIELMRMVKGYLERIYWEYPEKQ